MMLRFSEKLGHLPRPSSPRYFWWLALEYQPHQTYIFSPGLVLESELDSVQVY